MRLGDGVFLVILGFILLAYCGGSGAYRKEEKKNTESTQLDAGQGHLHDSAKRRVVRNK